MTITKEKPIPTTNSDRIYTCTTCGKVFSTFQALGGHRASHTNKKAVDVKPAVGNATKKLHGCHICGKEFDLGQALGGHMTKHRKTKVIITKTSVNSSSSKEDLPHVSTSLESGLVTRIFIPLVPPRFNAQPVEIVCRPEINDHELDLDLKL